MVSEIFLAFALFAIALVIYVASRRAVSKNVRSRFALASTTLFLTVPLIGRVDSQSAQPLWLALGAILLLSFCIQLYLALVVVFDGEKLAAKK